MMSSDEDTILEIFRKELNLWKKETLFPGLNNEGDVESIERRLDEAKSLFMDLMYYVNSYDDEKDDADPIPKKFMNLMGNKEFWSSSFKDKLRHILFTDLVEYPLTFNVSLINQFTNDEDEDFPRFQ
jgi:hypothetical protein